MPISRSAMEGPGTLMEAALIYLVLREPERALELFEKAMSVPSSALLFHHPELDPLWAPVRSHPRYKAALAKAAPRD